MNSFYIGILVAPFIYAVIVSLITSIIHFFRWIRKTKPFGVYGGISLTRLAELYQKSETHYLSGYGFYLNKFAIMLVRTHERQGRPYLKSTD